MFVAFGKTVAQAAELLKDRYARVFQVTPETVSDAVAFMDDDKRVRSEMKTPPKVAALVRAEDYDRIFALGKPGVRVLRNSTHANMDVFVLMRDCAPVVKERTFAMSPVVGADMTYRGQEPSISDACGCGGCSRYVS